MGASILVILGGIAIAWLSIKLGQKLILRQVGRLALEKIGEQALRKVPAQIKLSRVSFPQWKDAAAIQRQMSPLLRAGFQDVGSYAIDKMPGVLLRILFQSQTYVAAHITEHPKAGNWIEFATRYTDGSSDFLSTLADQGITAPPFVRTARADQGTRSDSLYEQHLRQRKDSRIKAVTDEDVIQEFEDAYMRCMIWKNNHGLTAEEVAQQARKWARAKGAGLS